ncbi:MAG: hypothetical protein IJZ06_08325 [Bacteroidales bacterium]|nr:hypothetical protein [Bacteroidales bacterium]
MKRKIFTIATLFVAAAISVAVVSCQKDNETPEENVVAKSVNNESKELLNRIYAFQELKDNINSGKRSGESMTLEELRDDIDLTFNYEHSQHALPCSNATLDTFYVSMPKVDANGNVSAADAIATYNAFEAGLESLMASVDDDMNLAKNFSIKFPEEGTRSGNEIEVVFTRATEEERYPWYAPFEEGDDYKWGKNLGHCSGVSEITDAADELTKLFQFKPGSSIISPYKIVYVEYTAFDFYGGEGNYDDLVYYDGEHSSDVDYWLFAEFGEFEEEPCIMYYELNHYYNNINNVCVRPNAPLHNDPVTGRPYIECIVNDIEDVVTKNTGTLGGQPSVFAKFHTLKVTYGYLLHGDSNSN